MNMDTQQTTEGKSRGTTHLNSLRKKNEKII